VAEYSTQLSTTPTTSYTATDMLGSPRVITDSYGKVTSRRDFMPFGEEIAVGVGGRSNSNKYGESDSVRQKFTGYQNDTETGLDFAEARMYNNAHGRFTAVDPLLASGKSLNPQTFNRYAYTMNRPLVLTDSTGLQAGFAKIKTDPATVNIPSQGRRGGDGSTNSGMKPKQRKPREVIFTVDIGSAGAITKSFNNPINGETQALFGYGNEDVRIRATDKSNGEPITDMIMDESGRETQNADINGEVITDVCLDCASVPQAKMKKYPDEEVQNQAANTAVELRPQTNKKIVNMVIDGVNYEMTIPVEYSPDGGKPKGKKLQETIIKTNVKDLSPPQPPMSPNKPENPQLRMQTMGSY
jgi:RHS repeat-associated protein